MTLTHYYHTKESPLGYGAIHHLWFLAILGIIIPTHPSHIDVNLILDFRLVITYSDVFDTIKGL
jgi:hypothetical protein